VTFSREGIRGLISHISTIGNGLQSKTFLTRSRYEPTLVHDFSGRTSL
jgi:hypothetical protein